MLRLLSSIQGQSFQQAFGVPLGHGAGSLQPLEGPVLFREVEPRVIERNPGGRRHLDDPLSPSAPEQLQGPVVTERIVAAAPEERVRGPRASPEAIAGIVAIGAVAPELRATVAPCEPQGGRALPDVAQAVIANVAADVGLARQRRTPLDRAVRLDADREAAGAA